MPRSSIDAPAAPASIGPYAHAAEGTGTRTIYLSGQTPIDPETGALVDGDAAAQTAQVFDNLGAVLAAAGCSFNDVVKVNVYLATMDDFASMNAVYESRLAAPYPARTTVAVAGLPLGARVEIEAVVSLS